MPSYNLTVTTLPSQPRFDSPLALWITLWQRQLVYGATPLDAAALGEGDWS
jgi:hypothetical protein